jgi:hypothetical protein
MDLTAATQDLTPTDDEAASVTGGISLTIPVPDIPGLNLAGKTFVLVPNVLQVTITGQA